MSAINELTIGPVPELNNLVMYRKVNLAQNIFAPFFKLKEDGSLSDDSNIIVFYTQYIKDSDGEPIESLTQNLRYIVAGQMAISWWNSLARTPITAEVGILDAIEATLQDLPIGVLDGYTLVTPNP